MDNGDVVKQQQEVTRQVYSDTALPLVQQLKQKKREILRFDKPSTLYITMLIEVVVEGFIDSCVAKK